MAKKKKKVGKKKTAAKAAKLTKKKTSAQRGPTKRAPRRRARMQQLTRAEEMILERMQQLDPSEPRYQVLEAALAFKASWVILGEHLTEVAQQKLYKPWGYRSFATYCAEEVRVTPATARKLVKSYEWLGAEAPELLPKVENGVVTPRREVPDMAAVSVLADARNKLEKGDVEQDAYLALKQAALEGNSSASELRKELRAAIPKEPVVDKTKALRRALTAAVKTIEHLKDWDGDDVLLTQAEQLRDQIADKLPREVAAA
jgi:hypothetical protein